MTDKTDIDPAVEAAGNVAEYMFPGCVSASDIDDDDMIELASIIRTAYAPEIVTLINATEVEANKHKRTMAYLEDARAKIQEQAQRIAELEAREKRLVELEEENIELRRRLSNAMEF